MLEVRLVKLCSGSHENREHILPLALGDFTPTSKPLRLAQDGVFGTLEENRVPAFAADELADGTA